MPNQKITQLLSLSSSAASPNDLTVVVDVNDLSSPSGTTKNMTLANLSTFIRNGTYSSSAQVNINSASNGPLTVTNGGTGTSSFVPGVLIGNGTSSLSSISGSPGQVLSQGVSSSYVFISNVVSSSLQINFLSMSYVPEGLVSSSNQIDFPSQSVTFPVGLVSSSAQLTLLGLQDFPVSYSYNSLLVSSASNNVTFVQGPLGSSVPIQQQLFAGKCLCNGTYYLQGNIKERIFNHENTQSIYSPSWAKRYIPPFMYSSQLTYALNGNIYFCRGSWPRRAGYNLSGSALNPATMSTYPVLNVTASSVYVGGAIDRKGLTWRELPTTVNTSEAVCSMTPDGENFQVVIDLYTPAFWDKPANSVTNNSGSGKKVTSEPVAAVYDYSTNSIFFACRNDHDPSRIYRIPAGVSADQAAASCSLYLEMYTGSLNIDCLEFTTIPQNFYGPNNPAVNTPVLLVGCSPDSNALATLNTMAGSVGQTVNAVLNSGIYMIPISGSGVGKLQTYYPQAYTIHKHWASGVDSYNPTALKTGIKSIKAVFYKQGGGEWNPETDPNSSIIKENSRIYIVHSGNPSTNPLWCTPGEYTSNTLTPSGQIDYGDFVDYDNALYHTQYLYNTSSTNISSIDSFFASYTQSFYTGSFSYTPTGAYFQTSASFGLAQSSGALEKLYPSNSYVSSLLGIQSQQTNGCLTSGYVYPLLFTGVTGQLHANFLTYNLSGGPVNQGPYPSASLTQSISTPDPTIFRQTGIVGNELIDSNYNFNNQNYGGHSVLELLWGAPAGTNTATEFSAADDANRLFKTWRSGILVQNPNSSSQTVLFMNSDDPGSPVGTAASAPGAARGIGFTYNYNGVNYFNADQTSSCDGDRLFISTSPASSSLFNSQVVYGTNSRGIQKIIGYSATNLNINNYGYGYILERGDGSTGLTAVQVIPVIMNQLNINTPVADYGNRLFNDAAWMSVPSVYPQWVGGTLATSMGAGGQQGLGQLCVDSINNKVYVADPFYTRYYTEQTAWNVNYDTHYNYDYYVSTSAGQTVPYASHPGAIIFSELGAIFEGNLFTYSRGTNGQKLFDNYNPSILSYSRPHGLTGFNLTSSIQKPFKLLYTNAEYEYVLAQNNLAESSSYYVNGGTTQIINGGTRLNGISSTFTRDGILAQGYNISSVLDTGPSNGSEDYSSFVGGYNGLIVYMKTPSDISDYAVLAFSSNGETLSTGQYGVYDESQLLNGTGLNSSFYRGFRRNTIFNLPQYFSKTRSKFRILYSRSTTQFQNPHGNPLPQVIYFACFGN